MIMGLGVFFSGQVAGTGTLPDPVTFSVRMEAGDIGQAQAWLEAGLHPDFQGSRIGSGLMIGAWEGNRELMRLFLARGANINGVNANGETPLALAAWKGHQEEVRWLLSQGARLDSPPGRWSALHYAVFAGHRDLAHFLMERGADINARSPNGSSVLMMAIYEGHEDLAQALIDRGAGTNVRNDWGEGALEWAMRFNRLDVARRLASAGEFTAAVNEPREKWGEPRRSQPQSPLLEQLLHTREALVTRSLSTEAVDARIAAERARIIRAGVSAGALPPRAATLEITARRAAPRDQSARLVQEGAAGGDSTQGRGQDRDLYRSALGRRQAESRAGNPDAPRADPAPEAAGYKVPGTTFTGRPRMPPGASVRSY